MGHSDGRGMRLTVKSRMVSCSHTASYTDPISVSKGEHLALTGREDIWDGHRWLWAIANDGREGWVPDDLITEINKRPAATSDFSAIELSCAAGETIEIVWQTHGWAWCRMQDGNEGWLPINILEQP